jgi:hypothetical protein
MYFYQHAENKAFCLFAKMKNIHNSPLTHMICTFIEMTCFSFYYNTEKFMPSEKENMNFIFVLVGSRNKIKSELTVSYEH